MPEGKDSSSGTLSHKRNAKGKYNKYLSVFFLLVAFGVVIYLIARNISAFGNVLLALIGFGSVVLVHEFGHFIFAKLSGIKVEAFSIFMPPTLLGVRKAEDGFRVRILPKFFPEDNEESDNGRLSFAVGKAGKAGETEYRIGLIPFGGFVKMLGQEDIKTVGASDDPRSYANKPAITRMAVIAAGVFFNIISAIIAFIIVFLIGINLTPAVVGSVLPNSPAARAGLRPGDEVIEIAGKRNNLDFINILVAAALSGRGEAVKLRVSHEDGSEEDFAIVAEQLPGMTTKDLGISRPMSLTIADVAEPNALYAETGLKPGYRIKAINGRQVQTHWELQKIVQDALVPAVTVLAERTDPVSKKTTLIETQIHLSLSLSFANSYQVKSESELSHIYSMVPRLRIKIVDTGSSLHSGDIILAVADVDNPTYKELREITEEYEGKELPIKVLRVDDDGAERVLTVTVEPERRAGDDRVLIGIGAVLDAGQPVVAKTIAAEDGPAALAIPRGAVITAVKGTQVSSFYDIIREIRKNSGQRITIDYRLGEKTGDVVLDAGDTQAPVSIKSTFSEFIPFKPLERLYKASGPINATVMGYRKTVMFIAQAYLTLKRFVGGIISPKEFMGPVGIVTLSYRIVAERPLIYYVYFLGLISAFIGVLNFVPMLPFDGGHIAFLLVEKIKGSPVNERVQGAIAYAGWVLVGALALYVTFNDIIRNFFS